MQEGHDVRDYRGILSQKKCHHPVCSPLPAGVANLPYHVTYSKSGSHAVSWGIGSGTPLSLVSSTAFRLPDPSVSPCTSALQTPNWGRMDKCCQIPACPDITEESEKVDGRPGQCEEHPLITSGLFWIVVNLSVSAFSDVALCHREKRKCVASWVIES